VTAGKDRHIQQEKLCQRQSKNNARGVSVKHTGVHIDVPPHERSCALVVGFVSVIVELIRRKEVSVTIKAVEFANGTPCPIAGQYLKSFNCEAYNGRGYAVWTDRIEDAMKFDNAGEAMLFWKQQSRKRPTRPDGKPNRPLTSTTIVIE